MSDEPSDDQLMRAYAGGNARAFDRLYRRHAGPLYRFVRRLLGRQGSGHVDEVFQETWARVVRARDRWAPQGAAFRTWLFTIAHRCAIDVHRRSGREQTMDDPEGPFNPEGGAWQGWPAAEPHTDGAAERSFWRAAGRRLLDCLESLPEAQRAVFLLHHEDGLSLADAARALELGFETAKSRLRYAMSKLRTCMGAYLPAASEER